MSVSTEDFRMGMRRHGGAVNVITSHYEGQSFGLTATSVCSVSAEPPRLLACVNQNGVTFKSIQQSMALVVNTLGADHKAIAETFAGMNGDAENDRFHVGEWGYSGGMPVLDNALVSFVCEVHDIQNVGTHGIIIADIKAIKTSDGDPLFYIDGNFVTSQQI